MGVLPFPLRLAWLLRSDVRHGASIDDVEAQRDFICWWLVHGCREYPAVPSLRAEDIATAFEPVHLPRGATNFVLPRMLRYLWSYHRDLQNRFDLGTIAGKAALLDWFETSRYTATRIGEGVDAPRAVPRTEILLPGGVNLIGYALADTGIGEDVRMLAASLQSVGVPVAVIARKPLERPFGRNRMLIDFLTERPVYSITILCMTGFDTAALALEAPELLQQAYVIGHWPWELPHWPKEWEAVYAMIDEIWAPSRYVATAFSSFGGTVFHMPMAVDVAAIRLTSRQELGLPDDRFLFLCCIDLNSFIARKNPLGAIEAFRRAFPVGDEPVALVIKMMGGESQTREWHRLIAAVEANRRIFIFEGEWSRDVQLGLIHACDAIVSLHRAEGFGRVLAEAMLLRKPVIATGFSGSSDLVSADRAMTIDWHAVGVDPDEYPAAEGQFWAEPDLADAARAMRRIVADVALRRHLADASYHHVAKHHTPAAAGVRYLRRLSCIANFT